MKTALLSLSAASLLMIAAQPSLACTITPAGDSSLRVSALHDTLDHMEFMTGFTTLENMVYEVSVFNYDTDQKEVRTFRLENTSPMCPKYKAIRLK